MARNATATTPYNSIVAITASDTVNFATGVADALIVTTTGNFTFADSSGNTISVVAAPVGVLIPVKAVRVNSTSLTAVVAALYY